MDRPERRDFLRSAGSFALLPLARTDAELVLHNGSFFTVDSVSSTSGSSASGPGAIRASGWSTARS